MSDHDPAPPVPSTPPTPPVPSTPPTPPVPSTPPTPPVPSTPPTPPAPPDSSAASSALRELFVEALDQYRRLTAEGGDFDSYWRALEEAAASGRDGTALALRMAQDSDPARRHTAYDFLSVLAAKHPEMRAVIGRELMSALALELGDNIRASIVAGIGETEWSGAIHELASLLSTAKGDLAWTTCTALARCIAVTDSAVGVEALLRATESTEDDVRDSAVMAFAEVLSADSEEIRNVLARRLFDHVDSVRNRAIHALARRHDERVVSAIVSGIESNTIPPEIVKAARAFPRPEYLPGLRRWSERGSDVSKLIALCESVSAPVVEAGETATVQRPESPWKPYE